ncbi:MAG: hypothetical protein HQL57_08020 [Magnetococcales bacterium]|nr:hypothetical protein [Magnetococcales bacterium]MBF0157113.1 hypothetical protein [Magnetococcales bacterium]
MKNAVSRLRPLLVPLILAQLAGCVTNPSSQSAEAQEPPEPVAAEEAPVGPASEVDLIRMSHALADALVAELQKNHPSFHKRKPILVTTFVNRNNLDDSSALGLLISDHLSSRITQQGYAILEAKLRRNLAIRPEDGEFMLSRDIEKLSQENKAYAVVVGTYTEGRRALDMTAKIIEIRNRQVLASVDAKLPLETSTRDLLTQNGSGGISLTVVDQ